MTADELYHLLPSIYRVRDTELGRPLYGLLSILAEHFDRMETDIGQLYDNWFIETCEDWVVPYIGDLLGVKALHAVTDATYSLRARVANTIGYRRRKGTIAMLEQLARDTTGWPARAVEFFELLGTTQYLNHLRLHNLRTPDLRDMPRLDLLSTPFDTIPRTVDVRKISSRRGKHNLPNIGLFVWRLTSYPLRNVECRKVTDPAIPAQPRFTFHPAGLDVPIFNAPLPEDEQGQREMSHIAAEIHLPIPLRRRALYDEVEAVKAGEDTTQLQYFAPSALRQVSVFQLHLDGVAQPIKEMSICDLSAWSAPVAGVAVDPVLGRIAFPANTAVNSVRADYSYGFSADIGGGSYERLPRPNEHPPAVTWQRGVTKDLGSIRAGARGTFVFDHLQSAVDEWNQQPPGTIGRIVILDSSIYDGMASPLAITIPGRSQLTIIAGQWADVIAAHLPADPDHPDLTLSTQDIRPVLLGNMELSGNPGEANAGAFTLEGCWVEGRILVKAGSLSKLTLRHATLIPTKGTLEVEAGNPQLSVDVESCLAGQMLLADVSILHITTSVIDGPVDAAIRAGEAAVEIEDTTVFGAVSAQTLTAKNSIFMHPVTVARKQTGCIRFCYVSPESHTPRQYRCQPDTSIDLGIPLPTPFFTSRRFGDPGYAQLHAAVSASIREGAVDESEIGVFRGLHHPQRFANLQAALQEYLRVGLEAGVFPVT